MSTEHIWAAPAVEDIDHGVAVSDTAHACDALFRNRLDGPEPDSPDPASATGPFGGAADRRALRAATRRLPPEERRVVRMRLSGHDCADTIADVLDLPRPRVVLLLARGLSRIRHDLLT